MNILVCIKQVPDTGNDININPPKTGIVTNGMEYVINPYDEYALEAALLLKDTDTKTKVTAVSAGPLRCRKALTSALAVGADQAIFIDTNSDRSHDSYAAAQLVGETVAKAGFNLILCGLQGADYNNGQFPVYLAKKLNLPVLTSVFDIQLEEGGKSFQAIRLNTDGSKTVYRVQLPAILSFARGKTALRYASLPGILKARKKEIATIAIVAETVAATALPLQIRELYQSEQTRDNIIISDTDGTAVVSLFNYLENDLKAFD